MKRPLIFLMLLPVLMLTACANQPVGTWYPISEQKKISAVHHWGLIAGDAVEQARMLLNRSDFDRKKPFYVDEGSNSHFDRAFRNYMISNLVNSGIEVSPVKEGSIEISYETQVVRHGVSFDPSLFGYKPGMATAGVAAYWVLRDASTSGLAAATLAGAAAYDIYKATEATGVELLITTSVVDNSRYVMRNTDAYYIEKADAYLFEPCRTRSAQGCRPKVSR